MRIKGGVEEAKLILNDGMYYYWRDSEQAVHDIFRALEKFHKMKKLGYTPLLRNYLLEACRPNRLQIWGTANKNNANSYARNSPELMYLVLDLICTFTKEVKDYLNERFGQPFVVTFTADLPENFCNVNYTFGRFIEPERILCIEQIDTTAPDPHFAMLRGEPIIIKYSTKVENKK